MIRIAEALLILIIVYLAIVCSGCAILQSKPKEEIVPPPYQGVIEITKTIRSVNWLATMCIIGCAACCMAGMNGLKWGWSGAATCLIGLGMTIATVRYASLIAIVALAGGALLVIASVLGKNRIIKELVKGTQLIRKKYKINDTVFEGVQTKGTEKEVAKVKMNMKLNGEME